jgi:uncharacterized protein (TIGR02996 family)
MREEEGFLQAIDANPDDDMARLAYADWLEERGDIRAEFLRLEVQLPKILARLNELRQQIDPAWQLRVGKKRNVVLVSYPPYLKINTIKIIREVTGLGLKEAKDLSEALPAVLREGVPPDEAEAICKRFEGTAEVRLEPPV